jgi:hypothetical protein
MTAVGARSPIADVGVLIAAQAVVAILPKDYIVILLTLERIVTPASNNAVIAVTAA